MPNPTRAQILNAHEALEELKNVALSAADFCGETEKYLAWKSEIIAALPPLPRPTMAEVEWDSDKHYLAEAEHPASGKVIMVDTVFYTEDDYIYVLVTDEDETYGCLASPKNLTPTGRRYTLTEVQE
mgnify:CR=1 FL=1